VEIEYVKQQTLTMATFVVSRQIYGTIVYFSFQNHVHQEGLWGTILQAPISKYILETTQILIQDNQEWKEKKLRFVTHEETQV